MTFTYDRNNKNSQFEVFEFNKFNMCKEFNEPKEEFESKNINE